MAYLAYAEIVGEEQRRMTQFMPARSLSRNCVRLGAPEPADDGVLMYVEVTGEEQRRMTQFMQARARPKM